MSLLPIKCRDDGVDRGCSNLIELGSQSTKDVRRNERHIAKTNESTVQALGYGIEARSDGCTNPAFMFCIVHDDGSHGDFKTFDLPSVRPSDNDDLTKPQRRANDPLMQASVEYLHECEPDRQKGRRLPLNQT